MTSLHLKKPYVAIQVRRTDKLIIEAGYYHLWQYMDLVNDFYDQLEMKQSVDKRRVYISTDDPAVIDEARHNYPHYEIISNKDVAANANLTTRYTDFSLVGLILDIFIMSKSDHIVCTLTSQVCRSAFEMMQTLHADASHKVNSLDATYYFNEEPGHRAIALLGHSPRYQYEANVTAGTLLETYAHANSTMGWTLVKVVPPDGNTTSLPAKYIPSFKISSLFSSIDFPKYENVKL